MKPFRFAPCCFVCVALSVDPCVDVLSRYTGCYHGAFAHPLYDEATAPAPFNVTAGMTRAALLELARSGDPRLSVGPHLRPVRQSSRERNMRAFRGLMNTATNGHRRIGSAD